jgi:ferredoxin
MIGWLRQRNMSGGVVFGPPAWSPTRIENTFESAEGAPTSPSEKADAAEQLTAQNAPPAIPAFRNQKSNIENPEIAPPPFHHLPHNRRDLALLLESLQIGRTSTVIAALTDQLRHLGGGIGDVRPRFLLLNLLPTQPEFLLGAALTRMALDDIRTGLHALYHILRPRHLLVVIDRHDSHTRRTWKRVAYERRFPMEVRLLLNRYPQAHPTILLRTLWGKRLQVDALPSRYNRLVIDAVTPWALGRYLRTRQPLSDRPVQLFLQEPGKSAARLIMATIGETVAHLCARYHIDLSQKQIILDGMLSGSAATPDTLIRTHTESISLRPAGPPESSTPCITCGWCVDVCPTALTPVRLMQLNERIPSGVEMAQGGITSGGSAAGLLRTSQARESLHCIACGLCSYVCPTRLPLMRETLALRLRVLSATGARHGPSKTTPPAAQSPPPAGGMP